jgi:site-specific DNA-cytosine methylase
VHGGLSKLENFTGNNDIVHGGPPCPGVHLAVRSLFDPSGVGNVPN